MTILVWRYFSAKLLCKDRHCWIAEEDRHLLSARHRDKRGNYVRLQIPAGGQQNSLSLRCRWLPRIVELMNPRRYCYRVRSRPGIVGVQTSNNWSLMMSDPWYLFCTLVLFEWENIYLFKFLCSVPSADCLNIHRHFRQTPRIWNFIFLLICIGAFVYWLRFVSHWEHCSLWNMTLINLINLICILLFCPSYFDWSEWYFRMVQCCQCQANLSQ